MSTIKQTEAFSTFMEALHSNNKEAALLAFKSVLETLSVKTVTEVKEEIGTSFATVETVKRERAEIKEEIKNELATKEDLHKEIKSVKQEISLLSKKLDIFIIIAIILMVLFSPVVTTVASKLLAFIK